MSYGTTSTYGSLQTKVSKKLIDSGNSAISASDVGDALNDALHYWKQKRFWFNEAQTNLTMDTTAATDGSLTSDPFVLGYGNTNSLFPNAPVLPQNFLYEFEKDGFVIPYSKLYYRFKKVSPAQYDDNNIGGIGIPYIYCYRNGNYEFYFLPNIAYKLTVNYLADQVDMVNSSDSNVFTKYADRLLMYEALSHLMGENRQDDTQDNSFAAKADREYRLLKTRTSNNNAAGVLAVESILH
jgi:hypothetical protein